MVLPSYLMTVTPVFVSVASDSSLLCWNSTDLLSTSPTTLLGPVKYEVFVHPWHLCTVNTFTGSYWV